MDPNLAQLREAIRHHLDHSSEPSCSASLIGQTSSRKCGLSCVILLRERASLRRREYSRLCAHNACSSYLAFMKRRFWRTWSPPSQHNDFKAQQAVATAYPVAASPTFTSASARAEPSSTLTAKMCHPHPRPHPQKPTASSTISVDLLLNGQRFRTAPSPSSSDPSFDESFLFELPSVAPPPLRTLSHPSG